MILCHGISSNRTAMLAPAAILHRAGFDVLLFDFRGCGQSGGTMFTLGYREVGDLLGAVAYVKQRPDCQGLSIGVLGDSAGAATAIMAAARQKQIRAIVAESPYATLGRAADNRFRLLMGPAGPTLLAPARRIGEWLTGIPPDMVQPVAEIRAIAPRPVLLIQDGNDRIAPPAETESLLRAAGTNASLWVVPHANHVSACDTAPREYARRITRFFAVLTAPGARTSDPTTGSGKSAGELRRARGSGQTRR